MGQLGYVTRPGIATTISQAAVNDLNRMRQQSNRLNRQPGVEQPILAGGAGDDDMRRFYQPEIGTHFLCQYGSTGLRCNSIAYNHRPGVFPPGSQLLVTPTSMGAWGQVRVSVDAPNFMKAHFIMAPCGYHGRVWGCQWPCFDDPDAESGIGPCDMVPPDNHPDIWPLDQQCISPG